MFCYVPHSSIEVKVVDSLQSRTIFLHIFHNDPRSIFKFPVDDVLYSIFFLSELSVFYLSQSSSEFLRESTTFIATVNCIILGIKLPFKLRSNTKVT